MVDYTSMKGLWIFVYLLAFTLVGCGTDSAEPKATPSLSPDSLVADAPHSSPTPGELASSQAGTGSSTHQGEGRGPGEGSTSNSTGPSEEGKANAPSDKQEPSINPGEWRKKHFKPRPFSEFKELRGYEDVNRLIPQPPSPTRVASGKRLYDQACVACHNLDGSPVRRDPALMKYNMADLSQPQQYLYGSSPKAVYRSIRYGVPSPPMGFTGEIYSQTEVWDMVNYIQSLQKKPLF